jgi:hypothetical protein
MSRFNRSVRVGEDRASLYTEITDKIIAELEAGRIPWVQPWGTAAVKAPLAMPRNATTQRRYSSINVLILWGAVIERGFSGQSWLTFRQALGLGGRHPPGNAGTRDRRIDALKCGRAMNHDMPSGKAPPTITPGTEAAYEKRFRQLNRAARRKMLLAAGATGARPTLTADAFVFFLLSKRPRYRANSWRQVRRAAIFGMTQEAERDPAAAPAIRAAISRLEAAAPAPDENLPPQTSSTKAKRCGEGDLDRLCFAVLAGRSPNGKRLVKLSSRLGSDRLSAMRMARSAIQKIERDRIRVGTHRPEREKHQRTFDRRTPDPALGSASAGSRGRRFQLDRDCAWAELCPALGDAWVATVQNHRTAISSKKKRPTLYSMREATARWKAAYLSADQSTEQRIAGLAIVAALLGHISDETASKHYGRRPSPQTLRVGERARQASGRLHNALSRSRKRSTRPMAVSRSCSRSRWSIRPAIPSRCSTSPRATIRRRRPLSMMEQRGLLGSRRCLR